jgi:hypothetical protein
MYCWACTTQGLKAIASKAATAIKKRKFFRIPFLPPPAIGKGNLAALYRGSEERRVTR